MGEFAEARKRLISKIEGCEATHQYMLKEHLGKRGVNVENYYRFNVEVGVGEFGMNEWNRLADISTGTRRYLGKSDVQQMSLSVAAKLSKIALAKNRAEGKSRLENVPEAYQRPMENPLAVELPAEVPEQAIHSPPARVSYDSGHSDQLAVHPPRPQSHHEPLYQHSPRSSGEKLSPVPETRPKRQAHEDSFVVSAPTPAQYATAGGADKIAIMSLDEYPRPREPPVRRPQQSAIPPPIPPKTPIPGERRPQSQPGRARMSLPYPDDDPPPPVNKLRKPDYRGR